MMEYLEKLRAKPGHVRERIAFGVAAGFTALVFVAWGAVIATNGTLALAPSSFAVTDTDASQINSAANKTKSGFTNLLGAAAAFQSGDSEQTSGLSADTGITVETHASTTGSQSAPTVIPF
jgi:hypothetical protein